VIVVAMGPQNSINTRRSCLEELLAEIGTCIDKNMLSVTLD